MARCSFKALLSRPHFLNNEIISGKLHLELLEALPLQKVYLYFYKKFECTFETSQNDISFPRKLSKHDRVLFRREVVVYEAYRQTNKLGSGHHTFPFQITLRSCDSGTSAVSQYINSIFVEARNYYVLEAFLKVDGIFRPIASDRLDVDILTYHGKPRKVTDTIKITSCLCLMTTNIMVVGYTDRNEYGTGDMITFSTRLTSNEYRIRKVGLRLYCHITLRSGNNVFNKIQVIARTDMSETVAGDCQSQVRVPVGAPSTVYERYLSVHYVLTAIVHINRTAPVTIERKVAIHRIPKRKDVYCSIGACKGIELPCTYISID